MAAPLEVDAGAAAAPRVLVIEDDGWIAELWSLVLGQEGYEVMRQESALGVTGLLRRWRPDVILLDLGLPYRSGGTVLAELKAEPSLATIPVVVVSGAPEVLPPGHRALVAAVLTKPVKLQLLRTTVRAICPPPAPAP